MENIKVFKNKHEGETIWVVGSGSSMNYVDKDFFNDKITIGVNEVWVKYDNLKYYVKKEFKVRDRAIEAIKGSILVCSRRDCGSPYGDITTETLPENVYYFNHYNNKEQLSLEGIPEADDMLAVSWSTMTSGMHLAYRLGARNIILCGHDCGKIDGKDNIDGYLSESKFSYVNFESQTEVMTDYLRKKGVSVHSLNPFINFGLEGHVYLR